MKVRTRVGFAILFSILGIGAALAAADFAGTWVGTTEIPDQGTDQVSLVLKKVETGYSGTLDDSLGLMAKETPLSELTIEGEVLSFRCPLGDGAVISVKMTIDGNKLVGVWEHPEGAVGTLALERK